MVRKDQHGVDFGLWKAIKPADLIIPTPLNPIAGHTYTFIITQDATGGRIVTFPDGTTWTGGYPNEKRRFSFYYDGTDYT
jgi:hypothetical protein